MTKFPIFMRVTCASIENTEHLLTARHPNYCTPVLINAEQTQSVYCLLI